MDALQQAKWEMLEAGGRTAQSFGLNRLLGQIYMVLFLSEEPQCLDDLCEQLGVSKASVSIACRQLESWGAVRRIWRKGDRRDFYEAESDLGRIFHGGLMQSVRKKLDSARVQIDRSVQLLEQDEEKKSEKSFLKDRLKKADQYRQKIDRLINNPLMKKVL